MWLSLRDVAAVGSGGGVAVGTFDPALEGFVTAHGTNGVWRTGVASAPPGVDYGRLEEVDALTANDMWAVGTVDMFEPPPLAHFDGTAWKYVALPFEGNSFRAGVTALLSRGPGDVWALGFMQDAENDEERALAWHYANGRLTVAANRWVEGPGAPECLRTLTFTAAR
ncbi:hypothetical protein [Streptodolium elevatio]